jgi:hypothetical protein
MDKQVLGRVEIEIGEKRVSCPFHSVEVSTRPDADIQNFVMNCSTLYLRSN